MDTNSFRAHLEARPFRAFTVQLNNGRALPVRHPEFAALTPRGWEVIIWTDDHHYEFVDLNAVSSLKVHRGRPTN
jgi:hypothetical protein